MAAEGTEPGAAVVAAVEEAMVADGATVARAADTAATSGPFNFQSPLFLFLISVTPCH
jgi:hypothetical protein